MAAKTLLEKGIQTDESTQATILNRTSKDHTLTAHLDGGTVTACTIDILGSIDGNSFFTVASHVFIAGEITAKKAMFHILDKPLRQLKAKAAVLTGTGKVTVVHEAIGDDDN